MSEGVRNRVLVFDALRIVACLMVVFSHVVMTVGPPWDPILQPQVSMEYFNWSTWGEVGVTIFLVLSGLSLENGYGNDIHVRGQFYVRRLVRIYPIYYMSLAVGFGVHVAVASWKHLVHGMPLIILPGFEFDDLLLALTGFTAFAGRWGGPLVWTSWFIGLIVSLYLVYPVISAGMRRMPWLCLSGLLVISIVSRMIIAKSDVFSGNPLEWFPLSRVFEFGLGIFLARVVHMEVFLSCNKKLARLGFLGPLSALTFPLFLVHSPLQRLIYFGPPEQAASLIIGIPVFLTVSVLLSKVVVAADQRISCALTRWQDFKIGYAVRRSLLVRRR